MNVTGVNGQLQGILPMNSKGQDRYEMSIQKQIVVLQEKMKNIGSDKEKPIEQKMSEKQEIQEQIQNLNKELRQYQIQKRQEEVAKRQEAAQKVAERDRMNQKMEKNQYGLSEAETGVIISLSTTKEQITGMKKLQTDLQGKLRTARSEEEKADLQEKIDDIMKGINERVKEMQDTITGYQKAEQSKADNGKNTEEKNFEESDEKSDENANNQIQTEKE